MIGRRTGALNPDVDQLVAELRRQTTLHRVRLVGLEPDAVRQLVAAERGADDAFADALHARTSGNPFFVHELLAANDATVPTTITELVALRIGPYDRPLGRLLGAAAVIDRDADIDLLAEIARLGEDEALDALDMALAADLLRERDSGDDQVSFSHAIVRETAYRALTGARRRRLHRDSAAALARRHGRTEPGRHHVEIAQHFLAAGSAADAVEVAEAVEVASSWCLDVLAYDEAVGLAEAALARAAEMPALDGNQRRVHARMRLHMGRALNRIGNPTVAREQLRSALRTAADLGEGELAADAALAMGGGPGVGAGIRWSVVDDELVAALELALDVLPATDLGRRARVLAALAQALYNDPAAAERCDEASATAVAIAEQLDDPEVLGTALVARAIALWRPAGLEERLGLERRAVMLADGASYAALSVAARIRLLPDAFEAADLELVRSTLHELDALTARLRQPRFRWYVPLGRTSLALLLGDVDQARAEADSALAEAGDAQAEGPALSHLIGVAMIERDRGEMTRVDEPLRERVSRDPSNPTLRMLLAVLLAEDGRSAEALELAERDLADGLSRIPFDYLWLGHLGLLAEVTARGGDAVAARALSEALAGASGRLLMLGITAPVGAADRALGLMFAVSGDLTAALAALRRAAELHAQISARYLEARTHADLAVVLRALGDDTSAAAAHARASAIADQLGLPTPATPLATGLSTT
jgi:tetratricopeptide (TPR) repeat protein